MKIKPIDSFRAKSESGKVYTILVMQHFNIDVEFDAEPQEIPGNKRFIYGGNPVTPIDEKTFKLLDGADIVHVTKMP